MKISRIFAVFVVFLMLSLSLTSAEYYASSSPSPSPSGSGQIISEPINTTTASNYTNTTNCYGEAYIEFYSKQKIDIPADDNIETLKKKFKDAGIDISNQLGSNPNKDAFFACTYPSSFSCPANCQVVFSANAEGALAPGLTPAQAATYSGDSTTTAGSFDGEYKIFLNWAQLLLMGVTSGTVSSANEEIIDSVMPGVMDKLQEIANQIEQKTACPAGSAKIVVIQVMGVDRSTGLLGITITIKYKVTVYCIKPGSFDSAQNAVNLLLHYKITKKCVPK